MTHPSDVVSVNRLSRKGVTAFADVDTANPIFSNCLLKVSLVLTFFF